jgi:hypothetical protein
MRANSRENPSLNEATSTDQIKGGPLPKMINIKAVYLQNVAAEEKVMLASNGSPHEP